MTFKQFVEQWAAQHPDIQHTPEAEGKNKRFFFCDGFAGMADFMRQQNFDRSPVIVMESGESWDLEENGWEYHDYVIYFCARASKPNDGFAAEASKQIAADIARQFAKDVKENKNLFIMHNLRPDTERLHFEPIGPMWDAWNMQQLRITVLEVHCI